MICLYFLFLKVPLCVIAHFSYFVYFIRIIFFTVISYDSLYYCDISCNFFALSEEQKIPTPLSFLQGQLMVIVAGKGFKDLWFCQLQNSKWARPTYTFPFLFKNLVQEKKSSYLSINPINPLGDVELRSSVPTPRMWISICSKT